MQDLFKKYLDGQCSPEEMERLLMHFGTEENDILLKGLISESLLGDESKPEEENWDSEREETFAAIKNNLNRGNGKLVPVFKKTWFRVAAAAVILSGGFAIYNLMANRAQKQDRSLAQQSAQRGNSGSNKAMLTLADGSTIVLENQENGQLAEQGNTKLLKFREGQLTYKSLNEKPGNIQFNSIATPRGGQYELVLSDGSKVWLNAASTLRFPVAFAGLERSVELSGEGYFEVAKNASMPFKVNVAGKAAVEVLGTHFMVNSYKDEASINTTLLEGRVKVVVLATGDSRIINPGEQAELRGNGQIFVDKNADTAQVMAWKNGAFNFNNADLSTVFRQLSRWYDVDVVFEGEVPTRKFSGEIQRSLALPQVLRLLEKNNVPCRIEGKKLIVLK